MAAEISGAVQTVARQATAVAAEINGAVQRVSRQATAVAVEISGAAQTIAEQAIAVAAKTNGATAATVLLQRPGFACSYRCRQMFVSCKQT